MPLLNALSEKAKRHLEKYSKMCQRKSQCAIEHLQPLAFVFRHMNSVVRGNAVRFMLLPLAAPPGARNELLLGASSSVTSTTTSVRSREVYAIRGKRMCKFCFSAIVQLSPRTVFVHLNEVVTGSATSYNPQYSYRRINKKSIDTKIVIKFLENLGNEFGLECPSGRSGTDSQPRVWLSRVTTTSQVHEEYCSRYRSMFKFLCSSLFPNVFLDSIPDQEPLSAKYFLRLWKRHMPSMRVLKSGSDFCDTCTQLMNIIECSDDPSTVSRIKKVLEKHKKDARGEFANYKQMMNIAEECCFNGTLHVIFDFAEKVLLPHLLRKPGQLHFVSGLKMDLFGVSVSNLSQTDIHCLAEGHWPGGKTANEVCSMLHSSIANSKAEIGLRVDTLKLHADNCGGQNKNRFILWYLLWRVAIGEERDIKLFFLIAGHTKNRCDGAFGFVKRKLRKSNVKTPSELVSIVDNSSTSNVAKKSLQTKWMLWKEFLAAFYMVPKEFKITQYHVFEFSSSDISTVRVKRLSTDSEFESFRLLKRGITRNDIRKASESFWTTLRFSAEKSDISKLPSAQEGTRKAYLTKNNIERYFPASEDMAESFFGSGS